MSDATGTESVSELGLYRASGIGPTTNSIGYPVGDDVASIEDLLSTIGVTAATASSPSVSFCSSLNSWPPSTPGNHGVGKQACGQIGEDLASAFATSLDSAASLDGVRLRSSGSRCNQLAVPSSSQSMADGDVEDFQMSPLSPSVKTRRDPSTFFVSSSSMSSSSSSSASSNCDVGNFPPMSGTSIDGTQPPQSVSSASVTDLQVFAPTNGSWFGGAATPGCQQQQQLQRGGIVDADLVDAEDEDLDRLRHSSSSNLGAVKRSANMTECVPVPSSEHVAEIVGRQGCKIKALRAKTNTYIKTPVRGDDPVFVITGRREDVACARREILSAAEHFSQIRASRRGGLGNGNTLSQPLTCSSTTPNPPVPSTVSESSPPITSQVRSCGGNSPTGAFPAGGGPPLLSVAAAGAITTSTAGNSTSSDRPMVQRSSAAAAGIDSATSGQLVGQGHVTIEVRVPVRVVGQVVGPKGATIKRIQAETGTYIVTPSRGTDPVFEIVGCPGNVERARREIESFAALGGGSTQTSRSGRPVDRVGLMTGSGMGKIGTFGAHHVTNGDTSSDWSKLIATTPPGRVCSSLMAAGLVSPLDLLRTGSSITDADQLHQKSGSSAGTLEHQQLTAAAAAAMMMKRLCLDESAGNGFRKQNLMSKANGEDLGSALLAQAMAETYHRQQQISDYDNGVTGSVLTPSLLSSLNQNWPMQFPPPPQQQQLPTTPKYDSRLGNFDIWNSTTASDDDVAMLLLGNSTFGFKPDANSPSSTSPLRYGRPNCLFGVGSSFSSGNDGGWVDSSAAAHVMQSWFDGNITSSGFKQSLTGNSNSTGGSRSPSSSPTNGSVGSPVTSGFPLNQSSSVGLF